MLLNVIMHGNFCIINFQFFVILLHQEVINYFIRIYISRNKSD